MKIIIKLILLSFLVISNLFAYPVNRPTPEAVERDNISCVPMWASITACLIATSPTLCVTQAAIYAGILEVQENYANNFKRGSKVINNQDLDGNGLNDFAPNKKEQSCAALEGMYIPQMFHGSNGETYKINNNKYFVDNEEQAEIPLDKSFLNKKFTKDHIITLPGCDFNDKKEIIGDTYQLFDPSQVCPNLDQIRISYDGYVQCIAEDDCKELGDKLVCAYEVDDMICAEAVYCSFNIGGWDYDGDKGALSFISNMFDYTAIDARVADGIDDYNEGDKAAIKDCKDVCNMDGSYLIDFNGKAKGEGSCFEDLNCSKCYNKSVCINKDTNKLIKDCDPQALGAEQQICGYAYNDRYLAHCIPKPYKNINDEYEFPSVISPHCTSKAIIQDNQGRDAGGFAGKAVRCIEQTITNIFNGTANVVENKQVTGLKCVASNKSEVINASECDNSIITKFQKYSQNIVTLILTLGLVFIGFMILLGVFDNLKILGKYILMYVIVIYFVNGNAWKDGYYEFLMQAGTELGSIVFNNVEFGIINTDDSQYAGKKLTLPHNRRCAFDNDTSLGPKDIIYTHDEKKYLIWDMYDCRMDAIIGSSGSGESPLSFLGTGAAIGGMLLFCAFFIILSPLMMFAFFYIMFKMLFIVVSTMLIINILIFVSPLIIPLILLSSNKKARGVFDNWLKKLLGYSMVMIVILVVLAMFFKVMDVTLYGNKIGDLYIYNEVKEELMISPECKNFYPLCFYNKVKNNQENNGVDAFFNLGIFFSFIALISRLLAIFGVMVLVLGLVTQSLIPTLLSVSLIQDNMEGKFAAAASAGLKIIGDAAKRGHSLAGKVKNRIAGMDQNKYKDGKEDNKNSEKENDIESEQVAQENNINKEQ